MTDVLEQIQRVSDQGLYYVALFAALAIPDHCGALESVDGQANRGRYVAWFDSHVGPRYRGARSGDDANRYRCSMLHQGTSQHSRSPCSRILFIEPGATSNVSHTCVLNDTLNIDVRIFVRDLAQAAVHWPPTVESSPEYQVNRARFVTRYAPGLAPYILGVLVIA